MKTLHEKKNDIKINLDDEYFILNTIVWLIWESASRGALLKIDKIISSPIITKLKELIDIDLIRRYTMFERNDERLKYFFNNN